MIQKVVIAAPRGYCAGVERAINIVNDCLELFDAPIYLNHPIIHNDHITRDFASRGVKIQNDLEKIPPKATVIFSAHGSPKSFFEIAKKRNFHLVDATCPLVTKVHVEARRYQQQGFHIVYIGHKNHPEANSVLGQVPTDAITLIESVTDVENLPSHVKIACLTQTTLSVDDTKAIRLALRKKFPHLEEPAKKDICYATQNRQDAVKELAKKVDVIFVIGSKSSSNSNRLRETAQAYGTDAYLIDTIDDIQSSWYENANSVGITGGASAPEEDIQGVISFFTKNGATSQKLETVKEDVQFTQPLILKEAKKYL